MMSYDLNTVMEMIVKQATAKGWKKDPLFCIKRARHELDEMEQAILTGDIKNIPNEGVDVLYFVLQSVHSSDPDADMNHEFNMKYISNWVNKKKTEDKEGNVVLR